MHVMVFVKATEESESGVPPTPEALEAMERFNEDLAESGVMQTSARLEPSAQAKRVAFDGPPRTVTDGPFAETRDLVAGFWIWEVEDMDMAVAWARRCPNPMPGQGELEIRPFTLAAERV